jgi:hypothetical protein
MKSNANIRMFCHIRRAVSSARGVFHISYCLPSTSKLFMSTPGGFHSFDATFASSATGSGRCSRNSSGDKSTCVMSGTSLSSSFSSYCIFNLGLRSFARKSSSIFGFLYPVIVSFSSITVYVKLGLNESSKTRGCLLSSPGRYRLRKKHSFELVTPRKC